MKIYIDGDCKCHTTAALDRTEVETSVFDGKCKTYIDGHRFVPAGQSWTRDDGVVFAGEMITPWKDSTMLDMAQGAYEDAVATMREVNENGL